MKKKKVCVLLAVMMVLTVLPVVAVAGATGVNTSVKVVVDGAEFTFTGNKPVVKDGIVFFPLETQAFSMLGLTVEDHGNIVRLFSECKSGWYQINSYSPFNFIGHKVFSPFSGTLPARAQTINGVYSVPISPIAEILGCKVEWNFVTSTITVTTAMSTVWT
jgi:hypothetical protein